MFIGAPWGGSISFAVLGGVCHQITVAISCAWAQLVIRKRNSGVFIGVFSHGLHILSEPSGKFHQYSATGNRFGRLESAKYGRVFCKQKTPPSRLHDFVHIWFRQLLLVTGSSSNTSSFPPPLTRSPAQRFGLNSSVQPSFICGQMRFVDKS